MAERTTNVLAAVSAHDFRLKRKTSVRDASANILRLTANGLPWSHNSYILDGMDNNNDTVDFNSGTAYVILTPPDAISMCALAVPMLLLYEGAIVAVSMIEKKRARQAAKPSA